MMRESSLTTKIGNIILKNPVIAASGTFGYGQEASKLFDINTLGGFVTKTITLTPREGNPPPRIYDLGFGVVNSIGLENPGLEGFITQYCDFFRSTKTHVFVSIYGQTLSEWSKLVHSLDREKISGFELNLSCPNIRGRIISADKKKVYTIISSLRRITNKILIAKLSYAPHLQGIARLAYKAGIDALTLINTLPAIALSPSTAKPVLGNVVGGLSGPCIKPVALRVVHEVASSVAVPVIGCGGIMNYKDVLQFLSLGAKAVQVGTANLIDPCSCKKIVDDLKRHYEAKM